MNLHGLILVGSRNCGPCAQAAQWLHQQGVPCRKVSIDGDDQLKQWVFDNTEGARTVPQFFYGGQWIRGGFKQVMELVQSGQIPSGGTVQQTGG
jgi:glutaredoxin